MKATIRFLVTLIVLAAGVVPATAQHLPAEQEAEKPNALEAQAYLVLEDVVAATPALKLPQNRSRLQIIAADLLWKRDQSRARSLFSNAAANILELEKLNRRSVDHDLDRSQSPAQLRQELVLTAARHDPALGYELFQKTRRQKAGTPTGPDDTYLEQLLLTQSMATDPDFALRKVEAMLDRGEYSVAIVSVLENFQEENKPGAARLSEESLGRYRQLLENVVVAALKPAPKQQDNTPDLLPYLRTLLPQIEQHLPARAQAVRQKITERSENKKTRQGMDQLTYLTQQGTSNNLLNAAASAPSEMRDRLYQQAAFKAMDEGSVDRARQIANDHLDTNTRSVVLQRIAAEQQLRNGKSMQVEELRQALAVIPDHDRVTVLLQLAEATKSDDPKYSRQFLDEAFGLVTRPATSYKQIEDQLQVAHVLGATEPERSLGLLESGINKLNELLSAAASLSGFEFQIFKTSEMPLPGDNKLGAVVIRYGQELAILAKSDFGRAVAAADQFQYPESRLFVRLSIVQTVLAENKAPAK
ncbi:MAG TPA: hypothetical protein VFY67_02870 [Pyrinomonadaceae bacterium]|nr:hypothetical protein [Pyrinomonadaceae bacterium]